MNTCSGVWMDAKKDLPPEGIYVLAHIAEGARPWRDSDDNGGVFFRIVKLERGISQAERSKMRSGELPDYDTYGWRGSNPMVEVTSKRSSLICGCDEHGNNLLPYVWEEFGPDSFFGQEIDYWMYIPSLSSANCGDHSYRLTP